MKIKILKKSIKEFSNGGRLYNLFVSFEEKELYNNICAHLKQKGANESQIDRFIKESEYNGNTSYAFGLKCSSYTFNRVERFGILDAEVIFELNGEYVNAKINVKNRMEQILGYEPPVDAVIGWASGNEPTPQNPEPEKPEFDFEKDETDGDLPF